MAPTSKNKPKMTGTKSTLQGPYLEALLRLKGTKAVRHVLEEKKVSGEALPKAPEKSAAAGPSSSVAGTKRPRKPLPSLPPSKRPRFEKHELRSAHQPVAVNQRVSNKKSAAAGLAVDANTSVAVNNPLVKNNPVAKTKSVVKDKPKVVEAIEISSDDSDSDSDDGYNPSNEYHSDCDETPTYNSLLQATTTRQTTRKTAPNNQNLPCDEPPTYNSLLEATKTRQTTRKTAPHNQRKRVAHQTDSEVTMNTDASDDLGGQTQTMTPRSAEHDQAARPLQDHGNQFPKPAPKQQQEQSNDQSDDDCILLAIRAVQKTREAASKAFPPIPRPQTLPSFTSIFQPYASLPLPYHFSSNNNNKSNTTNILPPVSGMFSLTLNGRDTSSLSSPFIFSAASSTSTQGTRAMR